MPSTKLMSLGIFVMFMYPMVNHNRIAVTNLLTTTTRIAVAVSKLTPQPQIAVVVSG